MKILNILNNNITKLSIIMYLYNFLLLFNINKVYLEILISNFKYSIIISQLFLYSINLIYYLVFIYQYCLFLYLFKYIYHYYINYLLFIPNHPENLYL